MNIKQQQAVLFQAMAHPVRLQILEILSKSPSCVCDLAALTGKRQPYISQHLAILRNAGLVTTERQGWNILYRLNLPKFSELRASVAAITQTQGDRTNPKRTRQQD